MEREEIFNKITEICRDVFDDSELVVSEKTTAADVAGWDSLTHLSLVSELEAFYGIEFLLDEVNSSKNLGELLNAVIRHLEENRRSK